MAVTMPSAIRLPPRLYSSTFAPARTPSLATRVTMLTPRTQPKGREDIDGANLGTP